jgi:hypothetical protein
MSDYDWKKIAKIVLVLIVAYVLYTLLFKSSSSESVSVNTVAPTKLVTKMEPFDALNSIVDNEDVSYDLTSQINGQYGLYGPIHTYELSFDDKASVSDSQLILEQVVKPIPMPQAESNPVSINSGTVIPESVSSVAAQVNSSVEASVESVNTYINENQQKISSGLSSLFDTVKSSLKDVNV